MEIGKANYTNTGGVERTPIYKLGHKEESQRTLVARVGPPMKDNAARGVWRRYIKTHFGYTQPITKKDGTKINIPLTFLCPEERDREGNITVHCLECDEIRRFKENVEAEELELKKAGKSKEDVDSLLKHKRVWLQTHNLDKKWYMTAKNQDNKWGYLTISNTCMKRFMELIKELSSEGLDPVGSTGVWFKFTRTGTQVFEIEDNVKAETVKLEGGGKAEKTDTLTEADLAQLEKIDSLSVLGRKVTAEQVKSIVESGGDENVLKAIFNTPTATPSSNVATATTQTTTPEPVKAQVSKPVVKAVSVAEAATMPVDEFLKQFES